ncbi:hypothetical protein N1F78_06640 [Seonamhaeicola sp. MEBiC1930]|uniref:hypothetical protein n=1 Tax=Seonamhaeicola sp. MEBiC01930 TaxID=2976768 RepID=UPI003246A52D
MKFLSPEIEALYKQYNGTTNKKSLVRPTTSCGIFQDCDYNEKRPPISYYQKLK